MWAAPSAAAAAASATAASAAAADFLTPLQQKLQLFSQDVKHVGCSSCCCCFCYCCICTMHRKSLWTGTCRLSELRAAWRTESGELFFNIQLPSASPSFPMLPSVFFCTSFNFPTPFSVSFGFLLSVSGSFWLFLLTRVSSTSFNFLLLFCFLLPFSFLQLPSASFSFLQLPSASFSFL